MSKHLISVAGCLVSLIFAFQANAQPKSNAIEPTKLLGVWSAKGKMTEQKVDMTIEGQKYFKNLNQVEDRVVWSYVYKELSRIPMVFNINLESRWRIRDGYLCERLTKFSVNLVSKPNASIVPAMMVAKVMEGLQESFKKQKDSKRESCNLVQIVSPNEFHFKDGGSSTVTKFSRLN